MSVLTYDVVLRNGTWQVRFDEMFYGPRASKDEAIADAVRAAGEAAARGLTAQVMVHEETGARLAWSSTAAGTAMP